LRLFAAILFGCLELDSQVSLTLSHGYL
jgi:hypothetical protein